MASASSLPALSPASPAASTASSLEDASAVAPLAVCEECEERPAVADCEDCGLVYCAACDKHRHRKGKLLFHQRKRLETPTPSPSPVASTASAASSCAPWSDKDIPPPEPGVDDVLQWSLEQVADWLRDHELDMFIVEFQQQQIDGASLVSAHLEAYLETQSSAARGHKKKLQREIQKLRTERTERLSSASESLTPVIRVYDQKKRHQMVRELKSLYANYMPITEPTSNAACDELVVFYDAFTNPEAASFQQGDDDNGALRTQFSNIADTIDRALLRALQRRLDVMTAAIEHVFEFHARLDHCVAEPEMQTMHAVSHKLFEDIAAAFTE
ncbi:hypothetical protein ATCC90586_000306 [Pythium insidiosum]|nr:hypothetical protein ATCC90586_000306 [Pythium insidiosum]